MRRHPRPRRERRAELDPVCRLAERTYINPGTLARSLLSTALDQADPDPATIAMLLDAIPGAWERAQEGLADVAAGRVIPLDEL